MAHALRQPLFTAVGLSSVPRRCFSVSSPYLKIVAKNAKNPAKPRQQAQPSFRLAQQSLMKKLPSDVGLLDQTFIPPSSEGLAFYKFPFSSPWLHLQWLKLKYNFVGRVSLYIIKWASPRGNNWYTRAVALNNSAIKPTAVAMYSQMYSSFAAGDLPRLRKFCADGLYNSFAVRVQLRPRKQKVRWELQKMNEKPRVVSNRGGRLPMDGAAIQQAVVRISSKQRMTKDNVGAKQDIVEYLVLQRKWENWVAGPWEIWGTTKPTSYEQAVSWGKLGQ